MVELAGLAAGIEAKGWGAAELRDMLETGGEAHKTAAAAMAAGGRVVSCLASGGYQISYTDPILDVINRCFDCTITTRKVPTLAAGQLPAEENAPPPKTDAQLAVERAQLYMDAVALAGSWICMPDLSGLSLGSRQQTASHSLPLVTHVILQSRNGSIYDSQYRPRN
jgi:hypothetical protein